MNPQLTITQEDLVNSASELHAQIKQKLDSSGFNPVLTTLERHLRQALVAVQGLGQIDKSKDSAQSRGIGVVKKVEKKEEVKTEQPVRKIGEVTNKPNLKSDDKVKAENAGFIQNLSGMDESEFRKKYVQLGNLKAIGKMINELEDNNVVDISNNATISSVQDEIWNFLHKGTEVTQEETSSPGAGVSALIDTTDTEEETFTPEINLDKKAKKKGKGK